MKNRVRPVLAENVEDPPTIADVGDDRYDLDVGKSERQLLEDVEDRILAVAKQDQSRRSEARQLPAKLAADRSTGSRYQNRLAGRKLGNGRQVCFNCVAAKQVLDLDLTKTRCIPLARDDFGQRWNGPRGNAAAERGPNHLPDHRARRRRHRDDDLRDAETLDDFRDVGQRSEHR
jgi:hypothetical protein